MRANLRGQPLKIPSLHSDGPSLKGSNVQLSETSDTVQESSLMEDSRFR